MAYQDKFNWFIDENEPVQNKKWRIYSYYNNYLGQFLKYIIFKFLLQENF